MLLAVIASLSAVATESLTVDVRLARLRGPAVERALASRGRARCATQYELGIGVMRATITSCRHRRSSVSGGSAVRRIPVTSEFPPACRSELRCFTSICSAMSATRSHAASEGRFEITRQCHRFYPRLALLAVLQRALAYSISRSWLPASCRPPAVSPASTVKPVVDPVAGAAHEREPHGRRRVLLCSRRSSRARIARCIASMRARTGRIEVRRQTGEWARTSWMTGLCEPLRALVTPSTPCCKRCSPLLSGPARVVELAFSYHWRSRMRAILREIRQTCRECRCR